PALGVADRAAVVGQRDRELVLQVGDLAREIGALGVRGVGAVLGVDHPRLGVATPGLGVVRAGLGGLGALVGVAAPGLGVARAFLGGGDPVGDDRLGLLGGRPRLRPRARLALEPRQPGQRLVELALQRAGAADREIGGLGARAQRVDLALGVVGARDRLGHPVALLDAE